MFTAKVFRLMVGSLSGSMEEVYAAKEVVSKWNQRHAKATGKLYLPVEWTTDPKEVQNIDVVIGIVGNWLSDHAFIQRCVEAGKTVLLFFNAYQDPRNTIQSEHDEVKAFRESIKGCCYCADYSNIAELRHKLDEKLTALQ